MTINYIHQAMTGLETKRRVFWSEADFQFALAWELQHVLTNAKIYLERRDTTHKYYVDIWVEHEGKVYPIELKYKTSAATIGDITVLEQSATDFGCYDYLFDIKRLEDLSRSEKYFGNGFAVMLTNDATYYNNTNRVSAYDNFKIYNGAKRGGGLLSWGNTSKGTPFAYGSRDNFPLQGVYTMEWRDYNNATDGLKYLVNQI